VSSIPWRQVWLKMGDGEKPLVESFAKFASGIRARPLRPKRVRMCNRLLHILIPSRGFAANWLVQPGFRGEPVFGDECSRGLINLRRPVEKTGGEKLNHERRESAWK